MMRIPQRSTDHNHSHGQRAVLVASWRAVGKRLRTFALLLFLLTVTAFGVRGSTIAPTDLRQWGMAVLVDQWGFNLLTWEVEALWQKTRALALQPARNVSYATAVTLVRDYLDRAQAMRQIDEEINALLSNGGSDAQAEIEALQQQLEALRNEQQAQRSTVEQILEAQVAHELTNAGMTLFGEAFPPVQFTFVEPPRKLVVSPRDQITTEYSRMLEATMSLAEIEAVEAAYRDQFNSSAYITNIGGLGAFPTMVVDRASLAWILSTVAHEWTHNYLTLFPLGFNYMTNSDFITMNETVAEIVGNEIGERALRTFYPELAPPPTAAERDAEPVQSERLPLNGEPPFDFREEMRATRLVVDQLLASGRVKEAERYMEARRILFVENGYPLRVLNQAYFAFHGSYGTSAASTSPIGPKMEALHAATADLKSFLTTVRSFTSTDDLDAALAAVNQK
jgi:hypothetical protein